MKSVSSRKPVSQSFLNDFNLTNLSITLLDSISFIKLIYILILTVNLSFISPPAHADFRKALNAYISKDGEVMLWEVKDAVDKKNHDGLKLFLHAIRIDAGTSAKSSLYEGFKDGRPVNTTLDSILDQSQRQSLQSGLLNAVNSSDIDTQYLFAAFVEPILKKNKPKWAKINDEYAQKGSYVAKQFSDNLIVKADAGDPLSQMSLGLKYLNFQDYAGYGCGVREGDPICQQKDATKAYGMLKQALETYSSKGHDNLGLFSDSMCDLLHQTANGNLKQLEQAYLWCVVGLNSGGHTSFRKINEISAPGLNKDFHIKNLTELKSLPEWMLDTNKELAKNKLPVFSYYSDDYLDYEVDIYRDGTVKVGFGSVSKGYRGDEAYYISLLSMEKDAWLKVSPKKVRKFLNELKEMTAEWEMNNAISGFCDFPDPSGCIPKRYQVTVRENVNPRRLYFSGLVWHIAKLEGVTQESQTTKRLGLVSALVEKHFPMQSLRCGLSSSENYRQACMDRDKRWTNLADKK